MMFSIQRHQASYRFVLMFLIGLIAAILSVSYAEAQKIHLVIAADTNAVEGVGAIAKIDQNNIEQLFESNVPSAQLRITKVSESEMKASGILKTIDNLEVSNEDTVVFYYSGHGAFDNQKQQQFLQLSQGNLYRQDVLSHIQKKQPRLSVLLTDCCNVKVDKIAGAQEQQSKAVVLQQEMSPLFGTLFIYCKGVVDVTSSKLGEFSFCDNRKVGNRGSCFTYPLIDLIKTNKDNAQMDWGKLVEELGPKVNEAFKELYPNGYKSQMSQTVVASDYPGKFAAPPQTEAAVSTESPASSTQTPDTTQTDGKKGYRFGVRAIPNKKGGMEMLEIMPDSPAKRSGLEAGDIITEINGKPINTEKEYSDAVDASGKEMKVKLVDIRNGKTITPTIVLGW